MRSPTDPSPGSRRIASLASAMALFWLCLFARECVAETHVWVLGRLCRIEFQVNKEFYVPDNTALDAWIAEAQNAADYYNDFMGPLSVDQLGQRDFFTDAIGELRAVKNAGVGKTRAELLAKIAEWKREVEDKWNAEPYTYNCCQVKIVFRGELRDPMVGGPEGGRQHFDRIAIMIPAPGNTYRSSMSGAGPFDANGFSRNPYNKDLTGNWSFDSESNYEAPHEVGHELGLRDRYHINAAGGSESDDGYADSLLGITGDHPENGKVIVRDAAGIIVVDHIRTILEGMDVKCPPECCPDAAPPVRPERIKRGSWRLPPAQPKRPHVASADHIPGSVSAEKTPDAGPSTTPDVVRTSDVTRPTDTIGPEGDTVQGGPTGPPTEVDTAPAPDTTEEVQYKKAEGDRTSTHLDAAVVYKTTPNGMNIDTSVAVTGQGANFRKWEVDDVTLDVDGEAVRPSAKEKIYIQKDSYFKGPAVATFVALGAQYRGPAKEAESGEVCPVTGQKKTTERKDSAVDRAGMAAGMGLLASQAKGEITGLKASFSLNKDQAQKVLDKKAALKVNAKNQSTHEAQGFKTALH